jgi:hypothetical protein
MRKNLARDLKSLRSRMKEQMKEFQSLSRDAWIITNSDIEPQKLHALGVITLRWNLSEQKLLSLFSSILNCPAEEAHALAHELGDLALISRIKILASIRLKENNQLVTVITNALDAYNVCRQNRNQLTHFDITFIPKEKKIPRLELAFARRSKSPEYRKSEPFPDNTKDLRRIARDIRQLNTHLYMVERCVFTNFNPSPVGQVAPLPNRLPVPELLWKPPPQVPKESKRPRKSSRT